MLFLSRKKGESVIINDEITITIQDVGPHQVKLSFHYPKGTRVLRQEVYNRIQEENRLASQQADQIRQLLNQKRASQGESFGALEEETEELIVFAPLNRS